MIKHAVLYVEDEETDVLLLSLALERAGVTSPLVCVQDGVDAIDYLAGHGRFADRGEYPIPSLILLDLNLPRKSGFDVLGWLRQQQQQLASVPVIVCTSSDREEDRDKARRLGATDYLVKTADFREIADRVASVLS